MRNSSNSGLCGAVLLLATAVIPHLLAGTPSQVTLNLSATKTVFGQPLALSGAVTPSGASGKVTFYDGTVVLGTASLAAGNAQLSTLLLTSGSHLLRAYYEGDQTYSPSTSPGVAELVVALPASGLQSDVEYPASSGLEYSLALADFNGDGVIDIVATGALSTSTVVSVFPGHGDGTFGSAINSPSAAGAQFIATGDFNGDGKMDVAIANGAVRNTPSFVSVLLGNGDGTFQPAANYQAGTYLSSVAVADFNGDGIPDLVVANNANFYPYNYGDIEVLLGIGDGTFQSPLATNADASPSGVGVGDFNGDGKPDLAVPNYNSNDISVLLGNGDGTFQSGPTLMSDALQPNLIAVADFNGDGKVDFAVPNQYSSDVSVFLSNGDGSFRGPTQYATGSFPYGIAAGDINGDGITDLAVSYQGGGISILLGNGDGTFMPQISYPANGEPLGIAIGDFNNDGRADIAISELAVGKVGVFLNTPTPAQTTTTLTSSPNPSTYGQTVTLSAAIFPPLASGTATFSDGSTVLGTGTLTGGTAAFATSALLAGSHSLTATYDGDVNDLASTSASVQQTVGRHKTATTLASSPNPSIFGQTVTLTAAVSPSAATGTVKFMQGGTALGSATITGGAAVLAVSVLMAGTDPLTATYSGDANFLPSSSPAIQQTVQPRPTSITLVPSPDPSTFGLAVTLTAKILPSSAPGVITFYDGSTSLGTGTLAGGMAVFSITTLSVGSHTLTAVYSANVDFLGCTSPPVKEVVRRN